MNNTRNFSRLVAYLFAAALAGTSPALLAAQPETTPQSGYGMGPGMMGGYGGGYGMMGPGMMGGYGMMGPGMMGGFGGGYGMMGPGMMGGYWGSMLDLTEEQQAKINKIQDEIRKEHWALMSAMMDQQAKLRDLYSAPKHDADAIAETYKSLGALQQQMFETSVDAQKRMEAILTKEQQKKLRTYWQKGWSPRW